MLFVTFSGLGHFLEILLPCRRELQKQGFGATKMEPELNKIWFCLCDLFWVYLFGTIDANTDETVPPKGTQNGQVGTVTSPNFGLVITHGPPKFPKWCSKVPKVTQR